MRTTQVTITNIIKIFVKKSDWQTIVVTITTGKKTIGICTGVRAMTGHASNIILRQIVRFVVRNGEENYSHMTVRL